MAVLIDSTELSWYVAGIGLDGRAIPLVRSDAGNLRPYVGMSPDEQLDFLRHRFSGVLQRGCDRLWGRQLKPSEIAFIHDGPFQDAAPELLDRVADHFVQWMTSPRVSFFLCNRPFATPAPPSAVLVAGQIEPQHLQTLRAGLPQTVSALAEPDRWELIPNRPIP